MHIDTIIDRLAFDDIVPEAAIRAALGQRDTVCDRILDIISRALDNRISGTDSRPISQTERHAFLPLLLVLGEVKEKRLFAPLLHLMRHTVGDDDIVLDDTFYEYSARILIATYDGDKTPLVQVVEDSDTCEFHRAEAFRAWACLAARETWPAAESEAWLLGAFDRLQPRTGNHVWVAWLDAVAMLGFERLIPLVDRVFEECRFGVDRIGDCDIPPLIREDFERLWHRWQQKDDDRFREDNLHPIDNTVAEVSTWHCYSERYHQEQWFRAMQKANALRSEDYRRTGRNDPCACGSGRKYKKCCLDRQFQEGVIKGVL